MCVFALWCSSHTTPPQHFIISHQLNTQLNWLIRYLANALIHLFFFFCAFVCRVLIVDKSLGDTSDIISDSSGVGTNSDSAACSIGHPSTTVVCLHAYQPPQNNGHLTINPGDIIEVVGSTDCGLLEGFVRGTNKTGFFPANCVQEVQFRPSPGSAAMPQQQKMMIIGGSGAGSGTDRTQYSSTSTLILQQSDEYQLDGNGNTSNNGSINATTQHKVSNTLTPTDKKRWVEFNWFLNLPFPN